MEIEPRWNCVNDQDRSLTFSTSNPRNTRPSRAWTGHPLESKLVAVSRATRPGATIPEECVGGVMIGFFEALPYSTLRAIFEFGWSYWGN
jgi:hypothetical protein